METIQKLTQQQFDALKNSVLEEMQQQRSQIAELLDDGDDVRMNVDTFFAASHNLHRNYNQMMYLTVSACQVGDEMQIKVHNRNGTIVAQGISPHGCMLVSVSISTAYTVNQALNTVYGFNQDVQSEYFVSANQQSTSSSQNKYDSILMLLEVKKLSGSSDWTQLGEFYFSWTVQNYQDEAATMLVTLHAPY